MAQTAVGGHVRAVGVLMAMQGSLATLIGYGLTMIPLFMYLSESELSLPLLKSRTYGSSMVTGNCLFGAAVLLTTVLQVVSGILTCRFRNRGLALVNLILGVTQFFHLLLRLYMDSANHEWFDSAV